MLRKTHQAAAWALRAATASFLNRTSLAWLRQMQARLAPEDMCLHQDVNKLMAALDYLSDATLNAVKFASRAVAANVTSRHLLWLRHWQMYMCSKWCLAFAPFKGGSLFGDALEPILITKLDKRKVLPLSNRCTDRRPQVYFRRQSFQATEAGGTSAPYVPNYNRPYNQSHNHSQVQFGTRDRGRQQSR